MKPDVRLEKKIVLRGRILQIIEEARAGGINKDFDLAMMIASKMYDLGARVK